MSGASGGLGLFLDHKRWFSIAFYIRPFDRLQAVVFQTHTYGVYSVTTTIHGSERQQM